MENSFVPLTRYYYVSGNRIIKSTRYATRYDGKSIFVKTAILHQIQRGKFLKTVRIDNHMRGNFVLKLAIMIST